MIEKPASFPDQYTGAVDWASSTPAPTASIVSNTPTTAPAENGSISRRPPLAAPTRLQKSSKALCVVSAALHIDWARQRIFGCAMAMAGAAMAGATAADAMNRRRDKALGMSPLLVWMA